VSASALTAERLARFATDPAAFIDDILPNNELGRPWRLADHQRAILRQVFIFDDDGRLPWETIVYSCPKKSGKTTLNAAVTLWWAFTQDPPSELLVVANDLEQAAGRVYRALTGLIRHNPALARSAEVTQKAITLKNGTTITVIASEYAGAAGSNHGLTSWDELWGYMSESSRRLYEELAPVPTRRNSIRFITTYAGWEGESELLWELYKLGVSPDEHPDGRGERLDRDLPLFANREARLLAYWDHEPRMPWQTERYYATQRRTLRPGTYARLHENRWTASEDTFITPALWDACVDPALRPLRPTHGRPLYVGVDASTKHDSSAVVAVYWTDDDRVAVAHHRIWQPTAGKPMDLEATIEAELKELKARYTVRQILCDPYQLHRSLTTLKQQGLPVVEFPQTQGSATRMGQALFDALNGKTLVCYDAEDLRQQALNTVAVESDRGFRITKTTSAKKIDAIVALSMAVVSALDHPRPKATGYPISVGDGPSAGSWNPALSPPDGLAPGSWRGSINGPSGGSSLWSGLR
jgi:phage terminase large subunit-like protein